MATEEPRVKRKNVDERDLVAAVGGDALLEVAERYGCGPIRFSGTADALYERHLTFDDVVPVADAGPRERFEAIARSVRDLLSQRWIYTEQTYARENPKRVYYLSMEFLLGRSLANNVTNLRIAPHVVRIAEEKQHRLDRAARAGAGRRPRQRRARSPGRLLPRLAGDAADPRDGLRAALRIRHLPAVDPRTAGSTSSRTTGCAGRIPGRSRVRASR